ncbi:MAG: hypothetical protein RQ760_22570, partial [Sedimentisphaerales bacterium]|nr:hypothetical protein [Sedimentisphaerales bacterium]
AVSPSSVYRVLAGAGLLRRWNRKPSKKGTGFQQPLKAHEHWHSAIGYITPNDKLEGRAETILAERDAKLAAAREIRKTKRKAS